MRAVSARRQIPDTAISFIGHALLAAAALWLLASPAHAALLCSGGATGNSTTAKCDPSYQQETLTCQNENVEGSCPKEGMAMRATPKKSFIKDFSPFLYAFPRDKDDPKKPYTGTYYRGTKGDSGTTFRMIGEPVKDGEETTDKQFASCVGQIDLGDASSPEEEAKIVRLQLDNCANQYILNAAMFPYQKDAPMHMDCKNEDAGAANSNKPSRLSMSCACQPLKIVNDTKNEYNPGYYMKLAWEKLLVDTKTGKKGSNSFLPKEPHLPTNLSLKGKVPVPDKLKSQKEDESGGDLRVSAIGAVPYEEINDPSHPFSPRWDFEYNERDKYSPYTQKYGGDPKNAVFCAGDKSSKIYKVDILSFRERSLQFDDKIMKRINWNANCKDDKGMQEKPCCDPQLDGDCILLPCSKCYKFKAAKPTCSTSYSQSPDRGSVKGKYLPVHPCLRGKCTGMASMTSKMGLSKLDSVTGSKLNVAQATSILNGQSQVLSSLPGNWTLDQAMPYLNAQSMIAGQLPNLNPNQLTAGLSIPTNLMSQLPTNYSIPNARSLMNSQLGITSHLNPSIPISDALSGTRAVRGMFGNLPGNIPYGNVQDLVPIQLGQAQSWASQGLSVGTVTNQLTSQVSNISTFPSNMSLGKALGQGLPNIGFDGIPLDTPLNEVNGILRGHLDGLASFGPMEQISGYANEFSRLGDSLTNLPNLPLGDLNTMFGSLEGSLTGITGGIENAIGGQLDGITGTLGSYVGSIGSLPGQILSGPLSGLSSITGSLNNTLGTLTSSLPLNQLTGVMNQMNGMLNNVMGNVPIGQVSGYVNSQIANLSNISGATDLTSVAKNIDSKMMGSFGAVPKKLPIAVVMAMPFPRKASCNPDELDTPNTRAMSALCRDLRAPYAPINKLKMRYYNPDDETNQTMKDGVAEGLNFLDYFKEGDPKTQPAHMPYPRLWDTGRSIQTSDSSDQDPMDVNGQFTAIVGVGRESLPGEASGGGNDQDHQDELKHTDQRCVYGGWGDNASFGGININVPDPITSWTELKLYQARTQRNVGMSCLGRYETIFKPGGPEDGVLLGSGAEYIQGVVTKVDSNGKTTYENTYDYTKGGATPPQGEKHFMNQLQRPYGLAWRGYLSATKDIQKFGTFAGLGISTQKGLDKAEVGDIILMPDGAKTSSGKLGLPKLGKVIEVSGGGTAGAYVKVQEFDNGKWPDSCGTTDHWGQNKTRYMYKGSLPSAVADEYKRIKANPDCDEVGLERCRLSDDNWNNFEVYKPYENRVEGNDGTKPAGTP